MTTVGEILRSAREKKKLTIDQVEKATRIRAKFIVALEQNDFRSLPGPIYARGFVKNYAAFLGLPIEETLAFYRRQASGEEINVLPEEKAEQFLKSIRLTPQLFTAVSVGLLLASFFTYLIFSYLQFAGSPTLLVSSPANNIVVNEEKVEVVGKTDPGAIVSINNQQISTNENGSFNVRVPLTPGLNTLIIVSSNKFDRKTTITRNLRLEK